MKHVAERTWPDMLRILIEGKMQGKMRDVVQGVAHAGNIGRGFGFVGKDPLGIEAGGFMCFDEEEEEED